MQLHVFFASVLGLIVVGVPAQDKPVAPAEPRVVEVVAKRFAFEPARIEVTEGERVRLRITSADGVHGFQVKKFGVNKLIPRGKPVTVDFVASAPGTFEILCSEECGEGHEAMTGSLVIAAKSKDR